MALTENDLCKIKKGVKLLVVDAKPSINSAGLENGEIVEVKKIESSGLIYTTGKGRNPRGFIKCFVLINTKRKDFIHNICLQSSKN